MYFQSGPARFSRDRATGLVTGILPYVVPLFVFPFHIYTVYALNILLMFWATIVHSSLDWSNNPLFLTTRDHNLHHTYGLKNCNFAAVFTFWDRIFGTINRHAVPPWWGKKSWSPKVGVRSTAPTAGPDMPALGEPEAEPALNDAEE